MIRYDFHQCATTFFRLQFTPSSKVNTMLEQYRSKSCNPKGSFSPTLAPLHSSHLDSTRARVEAGIFMLNEIFPNDIIVHDCINPKAKNQKDGTKAIISRASLIHLQAKDHRRLSPNIKNHAIITIKLTIITMFALLSSSSFAPSTSSLTTSPYNQTVCVKEMPYPPESDNARRIRFVSEVNAMASIKSRHTVPLLGIMFGVQGQEDSLGICIGNSSLASVHDDVMWSRSSRVVGGSGRLPRDNEALRLGGGDGKPLARISLVMPFYSLGSLGERLKHPSLPRLSWLHKLLLCWDIVTGVMDSHNADVIHKDLKCDNIVLERDALDLGEATLLRGVVCDFGLANVANQARSVLAALFGVRRVIFTAQHTLTLRTTPRAILQYAELVVLSRLKFGKIPKTRSSRGMRRTKLPAMFILWA
jgi:serine/threonine protein kinase